MERKLRRPFFLALLAQGPSLASVIEVDSEPGDPLRLLMASRTHRRWSARHRVGFWPLCLLFAQVFACGFIDYERVGPAAMGSPGQSLTTGLRSLGDGRSGSLILPANATLTVNRYSPLSTSVDAGSTLLRVSALSCCSVGDLVLIWQSALPLTLASAQALSPQVLGSVGYWEIRRVVGKSGDRLEVDRSLERGFSAPGAQVVQMPEYSRVEVGANASIRAQPWDGVQGGILAMLVDEELRLDGRLDVSGQGFRGGTVVQGNSNTYGCTALDEPSPRGGRKGEGIVAGAFDEARSGRGNLANAGGGGVCHNSGGGGGGNTAAGGRGGNSHAPEPSDQGDIVGGMGGLSLGYRLPAQLLLGGGGGAGEIHHSSMSAGGVGGGVILLGVRRLSGNGVLDASGQSASDTGILGSFCDAASGGGAGGSMFIDVDEELSCLEARARGGRGANVDATPGTLDRCGPGGGGGGGQIHLRSASLACPTSVEGGGAGVNTHASSAHGAMAGEPGSAAYVLPPP